MNDIELARVIREIQEKDNISRDNFNRYLRNHYPELHKEMMLRTKELDKFHDVNNKNRQVSIYERLYCLEHGLKDRPLCRNCKKEYVCNFNKQKNEYKKWCSPSCQASDDECIKKSKEYRKDKYGDENYNGIEKSRQTRYENNNGKWHSDDFGRIVKKSKFNNHGDEKYVNVEKQKETIKNKLEENPNYWKEREEKIEETRVRNGHDRKWNNREKFKETVGNFTSEHKQEINKKREETNLRDNGYKYFTQSEEGRKTIEETMMRDYGCRSPFQLPNVRDARIKQMKIESLKRIHENTKYTPLFTDEEFIDNREDNRYFQWKFRCNSCGREFESVYSCGIIHSRCPNCEPKRYRLSQTEVFEFVKSLKIKDFYDLKQEVYNIVEGKYLDICTINGKFAIEYDGLIWHTHEENVCGNGKPIKYHQNKTEECENKGFTLIHIAEDEWIDNKKLCKGLIRKITGTKEYRIESSECELCYIDHEEGDRFLRKYAFEDTGDNSSVKIGLRYKGHLVSILTFTRDRTKKCEWKISKYVTLNNFEITGDFKIMLEKFENDYKPKSLIFYVDRRWFNEKNAWYEGFELKEKTKPNYWYVINQNRFNPMLFTRKYIRENLEVYEETKSIIENMNLNGYKRYFDCGNLVYVKKYEQQ